MTLAYTVLFVIALRDIIRQRTFHLHHLIALVIFGLLYDNAIIAIGKFVGEGELLRTLSLPRFWFHAWFTPLLVIVGWAIMHLSRIRGWHAGSLSFILAWLVTAGLIVYQSILVALDEVSALKAVSEYGVLRYTPVKESGAPIMVIIVAGILLLLGLALAIKRKWPWLLIGVAILFIGRSIPIPVESSALTNVFELILIIAMLAGIGRFNKARTNAH